MSESFGCCKSSIVEFYEKRLEDALKKFIPISFHPGGSKTSKRLIDEANISKDSIILDVASGLGDTAIYIVMNFESTVIGIDLSRKMVNYANTLAKAVDFNKKSEFIVADAERIPMKDNIFDAAISECTLCLVPDMLKVLYEMKRVVKPGAKVVISDVILSERLPVNLINSILHDSCISGTKTLDEYISSFKKVNLKEIRVEDLTSNVIDQINQFIGDERVFSDVLEPDVRNLQKISINLWLDGKIKYYMISGIK